jgi:hypothetical protein
MKGLTSFKSPSIYLTKEGQNWRIDQLKFNLKYIHGNPNLEAGQHTPIFG